MKRTLVARTAQTLPSMSATVKKPGQAIDGTP
jgi:hypothetical protein